MFTRSTLSGIVSVISTLMTENRSTT